MTDFEQYQYNLDIISIIISQNKDGNQTLLNNMEDVNKCIHAMKIYPNSLDRPLIFYKTKF